MLTVKVKICGITNYEDAMAAVDMGADLLGFNFVPESPRYLTTERAVDIISRLPGFVDIAGVFVNATAAKIHDVMTRCLLDWVQLHGDESVEFCDSFLRMNIKTIKAFRVKGPEDITRAEAYRTDAVLFDAFDPGRYGGTGTAFDWSIVGHSLNRVFLAGGIRPENAAKAVQLGVYGIDVCSGIESSPGKKDPRKMQALFDNIREFRR
ncbi:MAG TPA: phosphoribosylanthranilate isomerase [Phycisphaerales bacterium]|nr:phosphoribosylanthranilate isomerase [Phycisphaerales bacterium]